MLLDLLIILIKSAVALAFISLTAMFLVWMERKVSAHFQMRYGPMRVGWHGSLQLGADALKLLMKEDIIPKLVDRWVFIAAPVVVFVAAFLAYLVIPFSPVLYVKDLNIGLLYVFGVSSLTALSIMMAGWSSNNKYALLGGFRSVAQIISYEIPILISVLPVIMLSGSFSLIGITEAQRAFPYILIQPVAFFIYLIAATAEVNRTPFDLPEAESELVAGYNVEYSGMKFVMFFFAEYVNMFTVCALATILFLGGWQGPILPPFVWFLIKTYVLLFVLMWWRWTFPRLRIDQMMSFCWKLLLPLALANLLVTGLVMVLIK
ncbi:NADH-quinone oxidoreductase subunit H [candidate division WOR-1 bacterium RIFCSPHIGHO2_01_FULL_53_15]|uniref:NADH-quinone oxidoreductase subunit H n=1 Tax=candidate division WOR-1 bacterium RIFCSPHIGHO2_01_FULL_53_15 TaxID=1802564 RepID=A0A1F4Q452_UNCSA|nr:MAG: NADH-quinone oxidoreductase subunit H [candidate division WOR-1 bacterium RIFCSPHIGHO2_01_FULL_53_15]OGC13435.1 MAG: NADH-quinone oxidoreductase subunit H [candidate division WOR-1 bacterium RIFCSPHIGHO2_02_FULL_53_26]